MPAPVSPEVRQKAVDMVAAGALPGEAAAAVGFSRQAVVNWCREAGVELRKPRLAVVWVKGSRRHELPEVMEAWHQRVAGASVDDVAHRAVRSSWHADATRSA